MKIAKEDKKNLTKKGQFQTNNYTLVWIVAQLIVTVILIVVGIIGLIKGGTMLEVTKILLGLDFLIMAYNNKWVYNRNNFTILYLIVGIVFLIIGIYNIVSGLL